MRKFGLFLGTAALLMFISVAWVEGQGGQKGKGGGFGGFGGFGGDPYSLFTRSDVKKELEITDDQVEKFNAEIMVTAGKVLSEKQFKRFKQIDLQKKGNNAFKDKTVQKLLKMSGEQVKNINGVLDDSTKALGEIKGGGFGGGGKDAQEKREAIRKEAKEKIMTVLSKDQRASWREMVGEEFKFQQPNFGGGGFGKKKDEPKKDTE